MRNRTGFTLIELLVVIAIIAILAAILFPVFAKAREKARQTSCLNNMKQIATASHMYSQDYDEQWTPGWNWAGCAGNYWPGLLQPYSKNLQIYICPSHESNMCYTCCLGHPANANWVSADGRFHYSYATNAMSNWGSITWADGNGNHQGPGQPYKAMADIDKPAECIAYLEASWLEFWAEGHIYSPTGARARIRHNGGLNAAFCDGHAKWVKYSNLKPELLSMQEGTYTPYPYPIPPVDDN